MVWRCLWGVRWGLGWYPAEAEFGGSLVASWLDAVGRADVAGGGQ